MAQVVSIVAVFVAGSDLVDALRQQVAQRVADVALPARIVQTGRELPREPEPRVGLGQQHHPAVAGDVAAVKAAGDPLAMKDSKVQLFNTLCHTGEPL